MKKILIAIVIAVVVVLVAGFAPLVDVPYQATETYYVLEPSQVTVNYTERVEIAVEVVEHAFVSDVLPSVQGKVRNTGNQTLHWADVAIWVEYYTDRFPYLMLSSRGGLDPVPTTFEPGEIRDFSVLVAEGVSSYEVIPTATQTLEKEMTEYRQVRQERTVTRYKRGSIFEYLRSGF